MKYIVYKMPQGNEYPPELSGIKPIQIQDGWILSELNDADANTLDWVKWKAVEVTEEFATYSLWSNCIIKYGQTTRYRKWHPTGEGQTKPGLDQRIAGSSWNDDSIGSLKYELTEEDITNGGEWNKFIMNLNVQEVFDSRYQALHAADNQLEMATWPTQLAEAKAYQADNTVSTPVLDTIANERDITIADLAQSVIDANNAYNIKVAELLNAQKKVQDQIKAANGIDETLLLKEDLFGIMVEAGLAISSGRSTDLQREVSYDKYGVQF